MNNCKPTPLGAQTELHSSPKLAASMPALQCTLGFHITDNAQLLRFPIQVSRSPPCSTDTPPGCALPHHAVTRQRIPQIKAFTFPTVREQGDRGQQYRHPALFPLLPSTKPFPNSSCHPPPPSLPQFNTNAAKLQNNTPLQVKHEMKTQMASQSKQILQTVLLSLQKKKTTTKKIRKQQKQTQEVAFRTSEPGSVRPLQKIPFW